MARIGAVDPGVVHPEHGFTRDLWADAAARVTGRPRSPRGPARAERRAAPVLAGRGYRPDRMPGARHPPGWPARVWSGPCQDASAALRTTLSVPLRPVWAVCRRTHHLGPVTPMRR